MSPATISHRLNTRVSSVIRRSGQDSAPIEEGVTGPLRDVTVRGGAYLVGRESIGMFIRLAGVTATLRLIGPSAYGVYTGAAAFTLLVTTLAQMGAEVYLIKMPETPQRSHYDHVFTFILVTSIGSALLALMGTFVLGGLLRPAGVLLPLRILLISVPINALWAPAQARIERSFRYRQMGILELVGDVVLYGTTVPLAFIGCGAWSLVAGFFAWQSWLLVGSYTMAGMLPRLRWSRSTARELTKYGFNFSTTIWIQRLEGLVNPLVVGSMFGAAGVGYVAFAQRLVDTIGFARRGAYRLGLVAMARIPEDRKDRLRRAVEEGSTLQLIALGVPFAVFGVVAQRAIPLLFGHQWDSAIRLYSLLALASVLGASGLIQSTLLFARGRNLAIALTTLIEFIVLAGGSVVLVQRFGIAGFGYASLLALVSLIFLDRVVRSVVNFGYGNYLWAALAIAPMVAFPLIAFPYSLFVFLGLIVFAIVPTSRQIGIEQFKVVRGALTRRGSETSPA